MAKHQVARRERRNKGSLAKGTWQLQEAKARSVTSSSRARSEGPQLITRRGNEAVVMISDEQYERLAGKAHQPKSLVQFFRDSRLIGVELDLKRSDDEARDIELSAVSCSTQTVFPKSFESGQNQGYGPG
jgi:antitoxin Phd